MTSKNQNKTTETTETPKAPVTPKLHAVKLLKNYRPAGDFKVLKIEDEESEDPVWAEYEPEGEYEILNEKGKIDVVASGDRAKCMADTRLMLPKSEAQNLLRLGIAEPHSELI
jgi:hypothetical protein